MIPGGRNFKKIEKKKKSSRIWSENRAKTGEKQSSAKFRSMKKTSVKWAFCCQTIPQHCRSLCEGISQLRKWGLAHECHFAAQWHQFRSCETHCEVAAKMENCCEIGVLLRNLNGPLGFRFFLFIPVIWAAKRVSKIRAPFSQPLCLLHWTSPSNFRSSSQIINVDQSSVARNGANTRS